jgi:hypothetical protein
LPHYVVLTFRLQGGWRLDCLFSKVSNPVMLPVIGKREI